MDTNAQVLLNWFAIQTRSNFEDRVLGDLLNKGFDAYLPKVKVEASGTQALRPLFRGYLFVKCGKEAEERVSVLRTTGIVKMLSSGTQPVPVPENEIENVRTFLNLASGCQPHPHMIPGSRVRIRRGPLKNIEGTLLRNKNRVHVVVGISMLSGGVSAEVEWNDIELVGNRN